jgi:hypothetical protein
MQQTDHDEPAIDCKRLIIRGSSENSIHSVALSIVNSGPVRHRNRIHLGAVMGIFIQWPIFASPLPWSMLAADREFANPPFTAQVVISAVCPECRRRSLACAG